MKIKVDRAWLEDLIKFAKKADKELMQDSEPTMEQSRNLAFLLGYIGLGREYLGKKNRDKN